MQAKYHCAVFAALFLIGLGALTSCSLFGPITTKVESIELSAQLDANQNNATAIDIVFVYDSAALAILPKTGPAWFDSKTVLLNGLASSVDVVNMQVPAGAVLTVPLPRRASKAIAVYCFPNYVNVAGQALGNITPYKTVQITLTPTTVLYQGN